MANDPSATAQAALDAIAPNSFSASFLFGGAVIILFAGKRLGELISPMRAEEFDFTKSLSLSALVGRETYNRALFFYVFLLEFFYVILCMLEPLKTVISDDTKFFRFAGSSWPLGAALLVVGVLPSTPIVAQIERHIRRFAHRMAHIPEDFYNRIASLSDQDIEDTFGKSKEYEEDLEYFWTIFNTLMALGMDAEDAKRGARRCASLKVFSEWNLDRRELWSQVEYEKYRDILDALRPRTTDLKNQIGELLKSTDASEVVSNILAQSGVASIRQKIGDVAALERLQSLAGAMTDGTTMSGQALPKPDEIKAFLELRAGWAKKLEECAIASKRHIALFAILAQNDRRTLLELSRPSEGLMLTVSGAMPRQKRFNDPVLRSFALLIRPSSTSSEPWYNSLLLTSFAACAAGALAITVYRIGCEGIDLWFGSSQANAEWLELVRVSFLKALVDAFFWSMALLFSGVTALFIRSSRIRDDSWIPFYELRNVPLSSYGGVFLSSSFAAYLPLMLNYLAYFLLLDRGIAQTEGELLSAALTNGGLAASFGIFAVGLSIVSDMVELSNGLARRTVLLAIVAIPIAFWLCVMILNSNYIHQPTYFLNQAILMLTTLAVGLYVYLRSFKARVGTGARPFVQGQ